MTRSSTKTVAFTAVALLTSVMAVCLICCSADADKNREERNVDLDKLRSAVIEKSGDAQVQAEEMGTPAAPVLLELLDNEDPEIRDIALSCLVLTKYDDIAEVLAGCLSDEDESVRIRALQSLRSRYTSSILPRLGENLVNKDPAIRGGVARLIGRIGDTSAMRPLYSRIEEETDVDASKQMKLALAKLGDADMKDEFASLLDTPTSDGRYQTIRDLKYIGDSKLARRLLPALSDTGNAYQIGHPDEPPKYARVCDAAVNLIAKWFDRPFSFEVGDLKIYSEEEIAEAERFLKSLE